jgi:hypothetical protein
MPIISNTFEIEINLYDPLNPIDETWIESLASFINNGQIKSDLGTIHGLRSICRILGSQSLLETIDSVDVEAFPDLKAAKLIEALVDPQLIPFHILPASIQFIIDKGIIGFLPIESAFVIIEYLCDQLSPVQACSLISQAVLSHSYMAIPLFDFFSILPLLQGVPVGEILSQFEGTQLPLFEFFNKAITTKEQEIYWLTENMKEKDRAHAKELSQFLATKNQLEAQLESSKIQITREEQEIGSLKENMKEKDRAHANELAMTNAKFKKEVLVEREKAQEISRQKDEAEQILKSEVQSLKKDCLDHESQIHSIYRSTPLLSDIFEASTVGDLGSVVFLIRNDPSLAKALNDIQL